MTVEPRSWQINREVVGDGKEIDYCLLRLFEYRVLVPDTRLDAIANAWRQWRLLHKDDAASMIAAANLGQLLNALAKENGDERD